MVMIRTLVTKYAAIQGAAVFLLGSQCALDERRFCDHE
jgi:hypothetical protein